MRQPAYIWILRIIPAAILLQTLFFKFSASPESVYIFSTMGLEPVGRIGSGVAELIAAVLILIPRTTFYGAGIAAGVMLGAVLSHLLVLGIAVKDDGGLLFGLALATLVCAAILMWIERRQFAVLLRKISG
ncbi:MAG: DoxX family protein [Flavobacterium sp. BFFFF1]|uniref:DoxX family protein n=1 Tax=Flavobacterium sp. BFFFF1 TaxID=2015557 RepID=UPI000BC932EF|nr:DoxX family protein [Flavobacterium sp. BFFFF1]OYU79225.1 MAG: DoxX family protein [Flavobacterium sp. BFFFF1]